jgi:hypothetical protein
MKLSIHIFSSIRICPPGGLLLVVFNPGAMHPVTTATLKALTCFCLPGPPEAGKPLAGNPCHPLCGWSLTPGRIKEYKENVS